jgi:elongation factor P
MSKITTADFQKGIFIIFKDEPNQIVGFQHVNPGKGSAFIRTKLKSLKSGRVQEFTYKSGETVEEYPVYIKEMQFLYKDGLNLVFMDQESFEQVNLAESLVGNIAKYIKPGDVYQIMTHEGIALGMRVPKKVRLVVTEADEGVKGNTVTGAKKIVQAETGVKVAVPLFIKKGDVISVDPETGEYVARESQK